MGIKTTQNFTQIWNLLRKMQKICEQKSYRQKKCANLEFVRFYTSNLYKFLANNFFYVHFFPIISTDLKSA